MGLEQYKGDMEMCCRCSDCKFVPMQKVGGYQFANVCPSISKYNFHSYSGGGRLNIGADMLKNGMTYTDKLLDIVYNCQMCGACGASCNYAMDMEVNEPISEFRIQCVKDGQTNPALDKTIAGLRQHGSMVPVAGKRGDWAAGLGLKDATREKVDVLYHVGCLTSYDPNLQKLAQSHGEDSPESRRQFRYSRRCRGLLRRPRLPDGLPGRFSRSGQEEHGPGQASRRQNRCHRLRRRISSLQGALRQVPPEGRPGGAAHLGIRRQAYP